MATELILLEDVEKLGILGDTVKVTDGYARNYLLPRGLAVKLTAGARRQIEIRRKLRDEQLETQLGSAQGLMERLGGQSITIVAQASDDEKLFGSVSPQQIADELMNQGYEVDRKQVDLAEPIRSLGVYTVGIKLHPEVTAELKVWIVKE